MHGPNGRDCWPSTWVPHTTARPGISESITSRCDDVDIVATLPNRMPVEDNSVGVIRAVDFLEHVADKVALINELYRALAPGGLLLSQTPSTDGRGAFQDPTHVAFYNENSFWYYTERQYRNFVPQIKAAFRSLGSLPTFRRSGTSSTASRTSPRTSLR